MEIESKFDIIDSRAERRLAVATTLGRFALGPATTRSVIDRYVDSADLDCLRRGYSCRFRRSGEGTVVTFKATDAPGPAAPPGTFRREEVEQSLLSAAADPGSWPDGPARRLALRLCGDRPLTPLLALHQIRRVRPVLAGTRPAGLLTLDRVRPEGSPDRAREYLIAEFELGADGTEDDLRDITEALRLMPGLRPSTESKLARGLAALPQIEHSPSPRSNL